LNYTFDFNNAFTGSGLTFDLVRNSTGFTSGGDISLPNTPRYSHRDILLCSAPTFTTFDNTLGTASRRVMAIGRRNNGQPYIVYRVNTSPVTVNKLVIAVGYDSIDDIDDTVSRTGVYVFDIMDTNKSNNANILLGQANDDPNLLFSPVAVRTFKGLIVVQCEVFKPTLTSCRFGAVYADIEEIIAGATDPWKISWLDLETGTTDNNRGNNWAMTYNINPADPNECFFGFSDYRGDTKTGYRAVVAKVLYNEAQGNYNFLPATLVDSVSGYTGLHGHFVFNLYDGSNIRSIISVGDATDNNHMATRSIATGLQYWSEATGWGGIDGAYQVYAPSTGWTAREIVHAGTGTVGVAGVIPLSDIQLVGVAPAPASQPGKFLAGGDENTDGLLLGYYDSVKGVLRYNQIFTPAVSAKWSVGTLQFNIHASDDGKYVTNRTVSPGDDPSNIRSLVLYSPDGQNFGVAAWMQQPGQIFPYLFGDKILFGNLSTINYGARYVPTPVTQLRKPLIVASNATNYIKPNVTPPASVPGGNIHILANAGALPTGIPKPPTTGTIYEVITPNANSINVGIHQLTTTGIVPGINTGLNTVTVRGYVYSIPFGGTGIHQSGTGYIGKASPTIGFRILANGNATDSYTISPVAFAGEQEWIPFIIRATTGQFGGLTNLASGWRCDVQIRNASPSGTVSQFYIAWDSVTVNENVSAGHGLLPGSSGVAEIATVSGFSCGDKWSIALKGMVPWDKYDHIEAPTGNVAMFSLVDGAKSIALYNKVSTTGLIGTRIIDGATFNYDDNESVSVLRAAPVLAVFNYVTGHLTTSYSVNGSPIQQMSVTGLNIQPKAIQFGESPFWVFGGGINTDYAMSADETTSFLTTLKFGNSQEVSGFTKINANRPINATNSSIIKGTASHPAATAIDRSNDPINSARTVAGSGFIPTSGNFLSTSVTNKDFRIDQRRGDNAAESGKRSVFRSGFKNIVDRE
jgi:hypothetical protein